ncbi:TdcF protein [Perkinsela sp. CCAP 1560/4]|nr:TdcF protein [Perkinsela sp. CCAP 1560/4]|eukprot:KNH04229.1 TdcF protein [Perkinsela sp. CCAP 1560/4]
MSQKTADAVGDDRQAHREASTAYLGDVIASAEQDLKEYSQKFTEKMHQIEKHIQKVEETIDYLIAELTRGKQVDEMADPDHAEAATSAPTPDASPCC